MSTGDGHRNVPGARHDRRFGYHDDMLQTLLLLLLHRRRAHTRCVALIVGTLAAVYAHGDAPNDAFVGSTRCASCHADAMDAWRGSDHDLAMQKPSESTVLGDFDDARFEHFGVTTRFSRRDERFFVTTDGPDGRQAEYEVAWVFGVYPLQQYLLPLPDGRLQALSVAWDSRPVEYGGQRWYHLYPDEAIPHDDPLHWTGTYQNWNTRCAECHSTNVRKGYDADTRSFATTFFEEDVGCEGCHGPGRRHVSLAEAGSLAEAAHGGFDASLAARGEWVFEADADIAKRRTALQDREQIDSCGRCHARRATLGEYDYGRPLSDTHRLALLGEPLYHHDGQILDEVYVYGSFVQSKMHRAGVVCSNCHEPHSTRLRADGNGVCAQCHRASTYDSGRHHRHQAGGPGSQCVACHMPARTYMGVDARRDHSMRIPRPDISIMAGTPNACTDCHADRSADWALSALGRWGITFSGTGEHPAVAMAELARGDQRAVPRLATLAASPEAAPIWRATALERSAAAGSREAMELATRMLDSPDPLLRVSAVRALESLPARERHGHLAPLLDDPVTGVRLELAEGLADVPLAEIPESSRRALLALFEEYRSVHRQHADMPAMNLELGLFNLRRGDLPAAEMTYREAIAINPQLLPARLNLADLLRMGGRDAEARSELEAALAVNSESGDAMHALGLLEARAGDRDAALRWLGEAAQRETNSARHRFVYAVAQHDFGDTTAALATLRDLHRDLPADEQTLLALVNYSIAADDRTTAARYARKLTALVPENPRYRQMAAALNRP